MVNLICIVHCTGWVPSVAAYLVWDSYDTGRSWWLAPKIRSAIRALPVATMRLTMGSDGYTDLVGLLGVIDRAIWEDVLANNHERSQGRRSDDLATGSRPDGGQITCTCPRREGYRWMPGKLSGGAPGCKRMLSRLLALGVIDRTCRRHLGSSRMCSRGWPTFDLIMTKRGMGILKVLVRLGRWSSR